MKRSIVPVLAVLCLSLSVSAAEPSNYAVANWCEAMVSADFDGDGVPDVAVACYDAVSVLLGNGDGTFQSALNSSSWGTSALAVGDFDQDGDLDLVTSNVVLLGNGDGTFASPSWLSTAYTIGLAVGDLDGDGKADLVGVVDYGCDEWSCYGVVVVQAGNGDGTFASATIYSDALTGAGPVSLADFDGDGDLDVASPAGLQLGNGDGTLAYPSAYPGSGGVADFNGDGTPDVATVVGYGYAFISLGNGDGTFQSSDYVTVNGFGPLAIADFDGDAAPDLAMATYYGIEVRLGNGDGTLRPAIYLDSEFSLASVTAADFDGDGLPDLAANGYDPSLGAYVASIFMNEGIWPAADAPSIAIADATVTEGNSGTHAVNLTVSLSHAHSEAITVEYFTADGTAVASGDYQATSGTLTIDAGDTSGDITVLVKGDRVRESDETFVVNIDGAMNAFLVDTQGTATILDDEPRLSITPSVSRAEGTRKAKTSFPFAVTLSTPYDEAVSVSFQTLAGTAGHSDYVAKTGSLTFNPGQTSHTVSIEIKGDERREPDETFWVQLYAPSANAWLTSAYGLGTIVNDD